jgi:prevent-host-death family protein
MQTVSIAEAKARLSILLDAVQAGEEVVITRRGQPVARLQAERPVQPDFSVFRRYRGLCGQLIPFTRDELHERD